MSERADAAETAVAGDAVRQLLAWSATPPPHAPGTHALWTDPHIATGMLAAHLDPGTDAASRRPATIDASVAWLRTLLAPGAAVLDLGCGPGLYTSRLSALGHPVTGIDVSEGSLAHARALDPAGTYLRGDYREVPARPDFDAVLLVYLDYGTFSPADRRTILERVRGWLAPGGRFVLDVATAARREGSEHRRDWSVQDGGFWAAGPHACLSRTLRYETADAAAPLYLDEHAVLTPSEHRVYRVWEQCFTPQTLAAELEAAGFDIDDVRGDLTGRPYECDASPELAVVARPR